MAYESFSAIEMHRINRFARVSFAYQKIWKISLNLQIKFIKKE